MVRKWVVRKWVVRKDRYSCHVRYEMNLALHHGHDTVNKATTPFFRLSLNKKWAHLPRIATLTAYRPWPIPIQWSRSSDRRSHLCFSYGLSDCEIKLFGWWNSDCYQLYIHSPLNLFLGIPLKTVHLKTIKFQYAIPYIHNKDSSEQSLFHLGWNLGSCNFPNGSTLNCKDMAKTFDFTWLLLYLSY